MNKLPITVTMISGAEAGRIGRALKSVENWAAEIIVILNNEVADGTEQIALQHGAKVYREPWKGFVGQKNSTEAKATQPWVLNLDADEVVSPALVEEFSQVINSKDPAAVYEFPRCTLFCGRWIRHGDWYPDRVRRLWRKGHATWVGEEPHATLKFQGKAGRLSSDLLHYTNETINHQVGKTTRYADSFVQLVTEKKKTVTGFDLYFRPWWRFVRAYFLRLGFLDGWQGYYIAWTTMFYTATRYAKVRETLLPVKEPPAPGT